MVGSSAEILMHNNGEVSPASVLMYEDRSLSVRNPQGALLYMACWLSRLSPRHYAYGVRAKSWEGITRRAVGICDHHCHFILSAEM